MSDLDATTTVEVVLRGRPATIEDVQEALDTLRADGVPNTFEVTLYQREEVLLEDEGKPYAERRREPVLTISARRAAKSPRSLSEMFPR